MTWDDSRTGETHICSVFVRALEVHGVILVRKEHLEGEHKKHIKLQKPNNKNSNNNNNNNE